MGYAFPLRALEIINGERKLKYQWQCELAEPSGG